MYVIRNDLPAIDERHAALVICEATYETVPLHVAGAHLRDGVWSIRLKSYEAKQRLVKKIKVLNIQNGNVNIHEH